MSELHKNRFANEHEVHSEKLILNKKNSNHYVQCFIYLRVLRESRENFV